MKAICKPWKYDKRIYYTLSDSAHLITGSPISTSGWTNFTVITLQSIIRAISGSAIEEFTAQETQDLWLLYIWPRFASRYICYVDLDLDEPDSDAELQENWQPPFNQWWGNFNTLLISTYHHYVPLIKLFKAQENDLMSKITSTTTTTNDGNYSNNSSTSNTQTDDSITNNNMNDVPTNYGDYSGVDYNTTIDGSKSSKKTSNSSSTEDSGNTNNTQTTNVDNTNLIPIEERLKNIRDKWENLYEAWAYEFEKLFMLSVR